MHGFRIAKLAAALGLLLMPVQARADLSARQVIIGHRANDQHFDLFLNGLESGIAWANGKAEGAGKALYCQPEGLSLSDAQSVEIMERFLNQKSPTEDGPAGSVLLDALQNLFPCK